MKTTEAQTASTGISPIKNTTEKNILQSFPLKPNLGKKKRQGGTENKGTANELTTSKQFNWHLDNALNHMLSLLFSPEAIRQLDLVFVGPFQVNYFILKSEK